jgi:hypothetical protein
LIVVQESFDSNYKAMRGRSDPVAKKRMIEKDCRAPNGQKGWMNAPWPGLAHGIPSETSSDATIAPPEIPVVWLLSKNIVIKNMNMKLVVVIFEDKVSE